MNLLKNEIENLKTNIDIKEIESSKDNKYLENNILLSASKGLINKNLEANINKVPKLILNDYLKGTKVLSEIKHQLNTCEEFFISVAFITMSGIVPLLETLKSLDDKNVKGKILTTDYLNFSDPKALKKLLSFKNIKMKVYTKDNFHTKGYIFKNKSSYELIIGSSNLTQGALTKNKEWNLKVSSLENGYLTDNVITEFNTLWKDAENLDLDWITTYEKIYSEQKRITKQSKTPSLSSYKLKPNKMQINAIQGLKALREKGENKALLISATGTGKTYLSAFELREFNPSKALFVVHREQIAKQALKSYKKVFSNTRSMGILSGTRKEIESDFIFSTIQTLSKDDVLNSFKKDEFDYIVIDEVHKAGANSYQKIVNYFNPKFLLGMTATPERNDDFDIFKMFNHNIAYEIRLQEALEEDLLCPFHYFGISDIKVNGKDLEDDSDFNLLISEDRVNHVIEKINFYGHSGNRVKGLVFCSNKKEAWELSNEFNKKGFKTLALTGEDSQEVRDEAIKRLEQEETENSLDYIFTVDIFNEGVDIPSVNQVIMLRPTQSSIIFVQQLGRGLRKDNSKEYVVILDFIGNYKNNFLIPVALSGDKTFNKDTLRKYVLEGSRIIPGCSTINFDEISKKKIFESIDSANFNQIKLIQESYKNLKQKLGKIPTLLDFDKYASMDPLRIFDNSSLGSYYKFLSKYDKEYTIKLNSSEELFIKFISKKFANGKRIHELLLLKLCIEYEYNLFERLKKELFNMNIKFDENTKDNLINIFTNKFDNVVIQKSYKDCIFIEEFNGDYKVSEILKKALKNPEFLNLVNDLIKFGFNRYNKVYQYSYLDTNLKIYEKYTYEDVCRILNWNKNLSSVMNGYFLDNKTKTFPVFINYKKEDDINESIKYDDRFISNTNLIAISKSNKTINSLDIKNIYSSEENNITMLLFIRKNKKDNNSNEFYFLGKIIPINSPIEIKENKNVEINYKLITPVRDDIYEYLTS